MISRQTPTLPHSPTFAPGRSPARRTRLLATRDVRDVEGLVLDTLDETGLPLTGRDLDELVACGIESVFRVERALSPGRPLTPVLDGLLRERLIDRWRSLHPERLEGIAPAAA